MNDKIKDTKLFLNNKKRLNFFILGTKIFPYQMSKVNFLKFYLKKKWKNKKKLNQNYEKSLKKIKIV